MQAAVPVINGVLYLGCTAICKPFYVSDERVKWLRLCSERPANAECSSRCIKMVHMAPRNGVCKGKRVRVPDLFEVLPQCFDFIDSKVIGGDGAAKSPPTVITCDTGLNQSVVVVLAWMVIGMGWKLSAASTFLKQLVPQSAPFVEYLYRLVELEKAFTKRRPSVQFTALCDLFYQNQFQSPVLYGPVRILMGLPPAPPPTPDSPDLTSCSSRTSPTLTCDIKHHSMACKSTMSPPRPSFKGQSTPPPGFVLSPPSNIPQPMALWPKHRKWTMQQAPATAPNRTVFARNLPSPPHHPHTLYGDSSQESTSPLSNAPGLSTPGPRSQPQPHQSTSPTTSSLKNPHRAFESLVMPWFRGNNNPPPQTTIAITTPPETRNRLPPLSHTTSNNNSNNNGGVAFTVRCS